ncbi:hypothetical protein Hanom_Chr05g00416601 [Helianthus anomalus]
MLTSINHIKFSKEPFSTEDAFYSYSTVGHFTKFICPLQFYCQGTFVHFTIFTRPNTISYLWPPVYL